MDEVTTDSAVIVLLAAGESRRYGGIKQLADIDGEPMVRRAARTALATGANVVVVTGAHAEQVAAALHDLPLLITHHPAWREGMGSSLAAGIRQACQQFASASGALLCLADQPLLDATWLLQLLSRHREKPERILATRHDDVAGPPVLFPRDCFNTLMHWSGDHGAHSLLQREAQRVDFFSTSTNIDVDTPDDLIQVQARLMKNQSFR